MVAVEAKIVKVSKKKAEELHDPSCDGCKSALASVGDSGYVWRIEGAPGSDAYHVHASRKLAEKHAFVLKRSGLIVLRGD